mmetsp:Transcript_8980/g.16259  ORF Transcript_8980/g.16259 Transcript_8980/m.16259 type:complete len:220 (-) Transcript_8980:53-712(-)
MHLNMKPLVVDLDVLHAAHHLDGLVAQRRPVYPARCLTEPRTERAFLALQQEDLAGRGRVLRLKQPPAGGVTHVDPPLLHERSRVQRGRRVTVVMREELGNVKPDAAGADHGHTFARHWCAAQNVGIQHDLGMVDAWDARHARHDTCGHDDSVVAARDQILRRHTCIEFQVDARAVEPVVEVFNGLVELLLPWRRHRSSRASARAQGRVSWKRREERNI